MFTVQQVEEAFIKKEIIIDGSKDLGIVCPVGHSKVMRYNEGLEGFVVRFLHISYLCTKIYVRKHVHDIFLGATGGTYKISTRCYNE